MTPSITDTRARADWLHTTAGQDYGGRPYIVHPDAVAALMAPYGDDAVRAALLHDTVEDTTYTLERMTADGYSELVVATVDAVTKRADETYFEFIRRATKHPLGVRLKLADNIVNSAGLDELARTEAQRAGFLRTRYARARLILTRAIAAEVAQLPGFYHVDGLDVIDADEAMQWVAHNHPPIHRAARAFSLLAAKLDADEPTGQPLHAWAINTGDPTDWELTVTTHTADGHRRPITADDIGAFPITYIPA